MEEEEVLEYCLEKASLASQLEGQVGVDWIEGREKHSVRDSMDHRGENQQSVYSMLNYEAGAGGEVRTGKQV